MNGKSHEISTADGNGDAATEEMVARLADAIRDSALPGENFGLQDSACEEAARFIIETGEQRQVDEPALRLERIAAEDRVRMMRLAIVNDDMPFLVDSVCATIVGFGLAIERLIHPVVSVRRDASGRLEAIRTEHSADGLTAGGDESFIYVEIERTDARTRRDLEQALRSNLADVVAAVRDWHPMQDALRADAERIEDGEGRALLQWFLDRNFTLLSHETIDREFDRSELLGVARRRSNGIVHERTVRRAFAWFEEGNAAPLVIKANQRATVHRHVIHDLVIVPIREDGDAAITALSISGGLWTSAALASAADDVPVLRRHLVTLLQKFAFAPSSHAGKSLTHALTALPHDLLIMFSADDLERLALTAMSLLDRPRPKLLTVMAPLARHMFVFIWLRRDQMSTERREAIEKLLLDATGARILGWSTTLDDSGVSQLRYVLDMGGDARVPDDERLDEDLENMVRGWQPDVERHLADDLPPRRAAVFAARYAHAFPMGYRTEYGAAEAATDIAFLSGMEERGDKRARLYRLRHDGDNRLRLKLYHMGGALPLSDAVPALENFGFTVLGEVPTPLDDGRLGYIHDFLLELPADDSAAADGAPAKGNKGNTNALIERADEVQAAITRVLDGAAENDQFNQLITVAGLDARATIQFRAWFRYLRQTGLNYGLITIVAVLARTPAITRQLIALLNTLHDPAFDGDRDVQAARIKDDIDTALANVSAIDDDRILRLFRSVIMATLRTNAYVSDKAALAFKLDSEAVPGLPDPRPWREIFVYSPRFEAIHLRAGPVARGGIRWSDRRDDFRTEILGLMKAQRVKNAVIVPTGAKGGFYPKQLPVGGDRDAFLAEGKEAYKLFIRACLSITDNIVDEKIVPPADVVRRDADDPYFVVAADKGTASFSDTANAIAIEHDFWLGDAFASGGSNGYDHKAMGITARGAWLSVQRHFAEMGVDTQSDPISVVGVGDMSGDVFGNGMLLSKTIRLVAAFDHRHIFIDPDPDPAASWEERRRLFELPRSSWEDYDAALISKGGGVFSRQSKSIDLTPQIAALLGLPDQASCTPFELMSAVLRAEADLLWFGGIGTYVKGARENHVEVGDPANDPIRVDAEKLRVKVIGEGANLGITQSGRIAFATRGGRINTDFIDNSGGVDCSDNEVNIKIALNWAMRHGNIDLDARNALLEEMTEDVAAIVLEDNRLQALSLSIAERGGAKILPSLVRLVELFESQGRLNRAVEGLATDEDLMRRAAENRGFARPELAVLLSTAKLALQDAIETSALADDPAMEPELMGSFPEAMRERHAPAIRNHQLRTEIIATELANRMINRLGLVHPFELAEEESAALGEVARAFVLIERLFGANGLWDRLDTAELPEDARIRLFNRLAYTLRSHMADVMRIGADGEAVGALLERLQPGIEALAADVDKLLTDEGRSAAARQTDRLVDAGAPEDLAKSVVRIFKIDGAVGIADLAQARGDAPATVAQAFGKLGGLLSLDWAQMTATRIAPSDPWERLLVAGLARDIQQLRLEFLARAGDRSLDAFLDEWVEANRDKVTQFQTVMDRARQSPRPSVAMLAQISSQARMLLSH